MATQVFPEPSPDETLDRYTIRCAATAGDMDPDDFNEAVWETWKRYRGPTDEEQVAGRKFDPERYQHIPGVCVFAEHKTTTADGNKKKYGLQELVRIVQGNNDRISDVAAFPAISDGHTSNPGDSNPREPRILGYAGNYRLGRIGRKKPRWAIFQDEYHMKDCADALRDKPRRSVELWSFADGRAHFDPVAAIGAEAPRLPLPQRFSAFAYEGTSCERYTFQAGAWASPGAGSTHVPTMGSKSKTQYSADPSGTAPNPGEEDMARLSPEDLQEIVAAIANTEQFKWITAKMEEEQREAVPGGDELDVDFDEAEPEDEDDFSDLDELAGPDDGLDEPAPLPDESEPPLPKPEEKNAMSYQADKDPGAKVEKPAKAPADTGTVEKYAALQSSHNNLMKAFSQSQERVTLLERRNADLDRRAKLEKLAEQFPGMIQVDEECQVSLYSLGGNMTNEAFAAHIATVEKYAERAAKAAVYIPEGDAPRTESHPEKYTEASKVNQLAVKLHAKAMEKGELLDYDTCRAKAAEQLGL